MKITRNQKTAARRLCADKYLDLTQREIAEVLNIPYKRLRMIITYEEV